MFTQLNPVLPVEVIDKGSGFAFGVIDYSQEHDLLWVVGLDDSGQIWCVNNSKVRLQINWSLNRP